MLRDGLCLNFNHVRPLRVRLFDIVSNDEGPGNDSEANRIILT